MTPHGRPNSRIRGTFRVQYLECRAGLHQQSQYLVCRRGEVLRVVAVDYPGMGDAWNGLC